MTHCSLQTKDQQESRAYAGKLHVDVVKFDAYRNSKRHRAVLPATARLFLFLQGTVKIEM